ncbi:MAG: nitroreductase [Salinivirgaceae bacterium]|nr:MAG: nitroreductase [Salinivirgaceae bacterium]
MEILDLIKNTRSYRIFDETFKVSKSDLNDMVNCARLGSSGRNQQSLKYITVHDNKIGTQVFSMLKWAGYLKNWNRPSVGERPTGYIIVLNDKKISENHFCDDGIALQNMMLCATSKGLGSCIIASVNKKALSELLELSDDFQILYVLAIGKPAEEIVLEEMTENNHKYWRDEQDIHHVPKRSLDEVIIAEY